MHRVELNESLKELFSKKSISLQWNKQFVGLTHIIFEDDLIIEENSNVITNGNLVSVGTSTYIQSVSMSRLVKIGKFSSIAVGVTMMGDSHPLDRFTTSPITYNRFNHDYNTLINQSLEAEFIQSPYINMKKFVWIENDVWIGKDVSIKPGIVIGNGSIVAQGAIVTKDIPPYEIWGGVPAKKIRDRFPEEIKQKLLELEWWKYPYWDFKGISGDEPIESFIEKVRHLIGTNQIFEYNPKTITAKDILETVESKQAKI